MKALVIAALCLGLAGAANAQTLRGLKTVEIDSAVSATSREDLSDCGVDVEKLKAAAALAMRDSRVTPSSSQPQATYFVHVVVLGDAQARSKCRPARCSSRLS